MQAGGPRQRRSCGTAAAPRARERRPRAFGWACGSATIPPRHFIRTVRALCAGRARITFVLGRRRADRPHFLQKTAVKRPLAAGVQSFVTRSALTSQCNGFAARPEPCKEFRYGKDGTRRKKGKSTQNYANETAAPYPQGGFLHAFYAVSKKLPPRQNVSRRGRRLLTFLLFRQFYT